jgi:hypothetical protein
VPHLFRTFKAPSNVSIYGYEDQGKVTRSLDEIKVVNERKELVHPDGSNTILRRDTEQVSQGIQQHNSDIVNNIVTNSTPSDSQGMAIHEVSVKDRGQIQSEPNPSGEPERSVLIWEIARAIAAEPGLFGPVKINGRSYRSFGFMQNNPSQRPLTEIVAMLKNPAKAEIMLMSMGTGPRSPARNNIWNLVNSIRNTSHQTVHESMSVTFRTQKEGDGNYFRFDIPELVIDSDEWKSDTLTNIKECVKRYFRGNEN